MKTICFERHVRKMDIGERCAPLQIVLISAGERAFVSELHRNIIAIVTLISLISTCPQH